MTAGPLGQALLLDLAWGSGEGLNIGVPGIPLGQGRPGWKPLTFSDMRVAMVRPSCV